MQIMSALAAASAIPMTVMRSSSASLRDWPSRTPTIMLRPESRRHLACALPWFP